MRPAAADLLGGSARLRLVWARGKWGGRPDARWDKKTCIFRPYLWFYASVNPRRSQRHEYFQQLVPPRISTFNRTTFLLFYVYVRYWRSRA